MEIGTLKEADGTCATRLAGPVGDAVLTFSEASIRCPRCPRWIDRSLRPPFTPCGLSFTKFLVAKIPLQELIGLMNLFSRSIPPRSQRPSG